MRALRIRGKGGPEVLSLEEVPEPTPGPEELRVRVEAAGLNRADLLQCKGLYPAPPGAPQDVPGLEYAGVVDRVGPRASRFREGDRVMGIVGGGAFAEQVVVHEREAVAVPPSLTPEQAAAVPEAFITAFDALVLQADLRGSEAVLIHAGASGVGTAAIQLASWVGASILTTVRSESKAQACRELGAREVILCPKDTPALFSDAVGLATARRGADVVLDLVGGAYFAQTLKSVAPRARWVLVGTLGGATTELPLGPFLQKRLRLYGTVLRSRPLEEKLAVARAFEHQVVPALATGRLRPVVDRVFSLDEVQEAFARMAANEPVGKLVLRLTTRAAAPR